MSAALNLDTNKGFLALPPALLELEMTPGAFRVLSYLCNLADKKGWSWPTLKQIGAKMKRGNAAISGYIEELRDLGLITTETQTMASGYNYRLKYFVTFWSAWITTLKERSTKGKSSAKAPTLVRQTERSVCSSERLTSYKHKIHETHTSVPDTSDRSSKPGPVTAAADVVVEKIYLEWLECTRGAPFGQFSKPVSEDLVMRTEAILQSHAIVRDEQVPRAVMSETLSATWQGLGVECPAETLNAQVQCLSTRNFSQLGLDTLTANIRDIWKHFWKYPPAPRQFEELVSAASGTIPQQSRLRVIKSNLKSWRSKKQLLVSSPACCILA
ncbi:Helix-turn-helix domain-containing protein [Sulfitobacter brevis]|uniref:Helix-turn-helix domain-containing protein n=1 Tax=Sulfitobacter brevis TaxID=74348 RepID=A0A1I2GAV4_9RHOB|nr:helix-turn-helix domain-containing protein [Sulfitobacter brevis]SFF14642.1 Helix-turn-helix domain-containing protein [Sulfitobacter brevis]